jgi:hypothetical protein
MNSILPQHFSPASRIWIYQSSRPFNDQEIPAIENELRAFAKQWTAHNVQLEAGGFVFKDRIIILIADESRNAASGCSIDTSVHFLKGLEQKYNTDLFNRMLVNYLKADELVTIPLHEAAILSEETLVIDPLVSTKEEFDKRFITPFGDSWIRQQVS